MISRLGARAYRCFSQLDIRLPSYAVIAGANGIGKSTLLDIPVLLRDMLGVGVRRAFLDPLGQGQARADRLRDVLHRGRGPTFGLLLEAVLPKSVRDRLPVRARDTPPTHVRYEVGFRLQDEENLFVDEEYLDLFSDDRRASGLARPSEPRSAGWRPVIERRSAAPPLLQAEYRRTQIQADDLSPDRLALSEVSDGGLFPATIWLSALLKQGIVPYAPDGAGLRKAQTPRSLDGLRTDATDLPWQVLRLQQDHPCRLEEWVHSVRLALPNVRSIEAVVREEDRHAYLRVSYRFGDSIEPDHQVTSSGLSDGTLRILAFTVLPFVDGLPSVLLVEQPEDGIHPRAVDAVLDALSALPASQTLVTTQSPVVLARTPLEHVICMRRDEDGAAMAVSGPEHPRLRDWQQDMEHLSLGTLFASGVLA